jgi:hypothetical protein
MAPTGIFARVQVGCGKQALVFSNPEKIDEKITVKATDTCQGMNSEIQLIDADGKVIKRFAVADGATETIHVTVGQGEWLNFLCEGKGGSCAYSVGAD